MNVGSLIFSVHEPRVGQTYRELTNATVKVGTKLRPAQNTDSLDESGKVYEVIHIECNVDGGVRAHVEDADGNTLWINKIDWVLYDIV